jgi:hypothetical protein
LALAELDQNKDGELDSAELEKSPGLKAALPQMDADQSGSLSAAEIEARVSSYLAQRTALMPLNLTIRFGGQPLAGAKVTLTPEPCLAGAIQPATGTTSAGGVVAPRIEGNQFPGINPGVYRVSISRQDENGQELLPAKFNAQTVLGIEAAPDVPELERGAIIELQ